ncbi:hypothetical protein [Neobacillus terrae]|uniref:hypothetical protein n=1 Tax=Neobacillus terrae TaxID=3034837 RepID=UPI00140C27CB|nr:hypothetical protein [Neobacillus terrae]NHM32983.1 hypothetical protein [Neobacillus terrae]
MEIYIFSDNALIFSASEEIRWARAVSSAAIDSKSLAIIASVGEFLLIKYPESTHLITP